MKNEELQPYVSKRRKKNSDSCFGDGKTNQLQELNEDSVKHLDTVGVANEKLNEDSTVCRLDSRLNNRLDSRLGEIPDNVNSSSQDSTNFSTGITKHTPTLAERIREKLKQKTTVSSGTSRKYPMEKKRDILEGMHVSDIAKLQREGPKIIHSKCGRGIDKETLQRSQSECKRRMVSRAIGKEWRQHHS